MKTLPAALIVLLGFTATLALADVGNAEKLVYKYSAIAKKTNADYAGPSAKAGKLFFNRKIMLRNGKEIACASCHTSNPANPGKHIITGKTIFPLSPSVDQRRFSNLDKVEDQFTQHCNDIIGNDCTAKEKADYIAYLLTEKTPTYKK